MPLAQDNSTIALPPQGRTVTTLSAYLANNAVYNVKDYGAVGDGEPETDDTGAVLAAIAAAEASPNGTVYFPPGSYRITDSLRLSAGNGLTSKPVVFCGAGQASQIINACAASTPTFHMSSGSYWTIRDLLLTGNTTHPNDGILVEGQVSGTDHPTRWVIERVVTQTAGKGIVLKDTNTGVIRDCKHWPSSNGAGAPVPPLVSVGLISHGIYMTGGFVNDVSIYDFDCQPSSSYAAGMASIRCDAVNNVANRILGGSMEGEALTPAYSLNLDNWRHFTIIGPYAENSRFKFTNCEYGFVNAVDKAAAGGTEFAGTCFMIKTSVCQDDSLLIGASCQDLSFEYCVYDSVVAADC